ncbi:MAG TPA: hypothetical protein VE777_05790, partial [Gaiellales bacterium]|nr:hypothetical protein [Gaiellales bacterium]
MRASIVRLPIIAALGLTAALAGAQPADAAALDGCGDVQLSQPFLPWGDAAEYKLAPDGGLEQGGDAWSLQGGAAVVAGNEPFQVGGAGDAASLELPAGSSATTAPVCVDLDSPTVRLFVQNSGDPLSTLEVTVVVQTILGRETLPVGVVTGSEDWRPTAP